MPILGRAITALGHNWHPNHFICRGCSRPIADESFYVAGDQPYHSDCYAQSVVKRCAYCNAPLLGSYRVDFFGTAFCPIHGAQYPTCTYCGRLVPTATHEGAICLHCRLTAIDSPTKAKRPVEVVRSWLANRGLLLRKGRVSLELCDRSRLDALSDGLPGAKHLGVTRTTMWNPFGNPSSVGILSGLPVLLFQGVVAHELGHAWLHENQVHGLPLKQEEGLCELLSFCFYKEAAKEAEGAYHAESIEKNPDGIYGDRFRFVYSQYLRMGLSTLVQFVKARKQLPS